MNDHLSESADDVDLKSIAEKRVGSNPTVITHLSMADRKNIPVQCKLCNSTLKNCFVLAAHKGWCEGTRKKETLFNGQRGSSLGARKHSFEDVLQENSSFSTGKAKRAFIESGNAYQCAICHLSKWQGKNLVLELDHINGVSNDHRRDNIRLLCPNCHSQTPTFRGRNVKNHGHKKVTDELLLSTLHETTSVREALIRSGLAPKGGNYARCYRLLSMEKLGQVM